MGLGAAIAYFTSIGAPILIPLNDTQKYDLVVELNGVLKKVQVKTTCQTAKSGNFVVGLKNSGGSSGVSKVRNFDPTDSDLLFVLTALGDLLVIPTNEIDSVSSFTLTDDRVAKYKVTLNSWKQ